MSGGSVPCGFPGRGLEGALTRELPRLRRYLAATRRRIPGLEPDDLVQECLTRALRYGGAFDPCRPLWPWLRALADRLLLDQRDDSARRPDSRADLDAPAPAGTPEVESREEVARLLASLTPVEREVLARFHGHGDSIRTIALALRLPEGTVKSHLSRARRRLAGLLDEESNHG